MKDQTKVLHAFLDGNLLRLRPITEEANALLFEHLSYQRRETRFTPGGPGKSKKAPIETRHIQCYVLKEQLAARQAITNAGYLPRIKKVFEERGYRVEVCDLRPHPNPEKFTPHWPNVERFEFRPGQLEALRAVASSSRGRIWWPTGGGKSFLVPLICLLYPKLEIVVTTRHSAPLEDLFANLSDHLPSVGVYHSKQKRTGRRVMCYSAGCLHHADPDTTDLLIADEVHELATDSMFEKFAKFRRSRMLGLSANMDDRWDGADFELEGLFGPVIAKLTYEEGVSQGSIVPIRVLWRDVHLDRNPADGYTDIARKRHGLWRNEARNKLIAQDAQSFPDDHQVLITVATFDHACHLKKLLPEFTLVYAPSDNKEPLIDRYVRWGLLSEDEPAMTRHRLEMLKNRFEDGRLKKVIATTVWNRGVNFRQLQVLIRADGASSAIADTQIPGRLSRTHEGIDKPCGILIDYRDQFDSALAGQARKRFRDYKDKKWENIVPTKALGGLTNGH